MKGFGAWLCSPMDRATMSHHHSDILLAERGDCERIVGGQNELAVVGLLVFSGSLSDQF